MRGEAAVPRVGGGRRTRRLQELVPERPARREGSSQVRRPAAAKPAPPRFHPGRSTAPCLAGPRLRSRGPIRPVRTSGSRARKARRRFRAARSGSGRAGCLPGRGRRSGSGRRGPLPPASAAAFPVVLLVVPVREVRRRGGGRGVGEQGIDGGDVSRAGRKGSQGQRKSESRAAPAPRRRRTVRWPPPRPGGRRRCPPRKRRSPG